MRIDWRNLEESLATEHLSKEDRMGVFCEIFGHSFEQPRNAEAVRSSDGELMVHGWICRMCQAGIETFEPMEDFIERVAKWARQSGGLKLPPPPWLAPPKPGRFPERRVRERAQVWPFRLR